MLLQGASVRIYLSSLFVVGLEIDEPQEASSMKQMLLFNGNYTQQAQPQSQHACIIKLVVLHPQAGVRLPDD